MENRVHVLPSSHPALFPSKIKLLRASTKAWSTNLNRRTSKTRRLRTASVIPVLQPCADGPRLRTNRSSRTSVPTSASKLALADTLAA